MQLHSLLSLFGLNFSILYRFFIGMEKFVLGLTKKYFKEKGFNLVSCVKLFFPQSFYPGFTVPLAFGS
jgi:hypothetical protein